MLMSENNFTVKKLYYSIGEVAEILGENPSLVRFWSDRFSRFVKPERNKKGNRKYTEEDVKTLKTIYHLVKERGMTLDGAEARLKNQTEGADKRAEVVEKLMGIKENLLQIQRELVVEEE